MSQSSFKKRVETLRGLVKEGCDFEVTDKTEHFRVVRYGGEFEFSKIIVSSVSSTDTLYDIGANVGMVALHSGIRGELVVAFEPDPHHIKKLKHNIGLNNLNNVVVESVAISDEEGCADLFTDEVGGKSPALANIHQQNSVRVAVSTLDALIKRKSLPTPTLIKIDIEGAEHQALRGMTTLLRGPAAPRTLFIEVHPEFLALMDSSSQQIMKLLEGCGYRCVFECHRHNQVHCVFWRSVPLGMAVGEQPPAADGDIAARILYETWQHALYLEAPELSIEGVLSRFRHQLEDVLIAMSYASIRRDDASILTVGNFAEERIASWTFVDQPITSLTRWCPLAVKSKHPHLDEKGLSGVFADELKSKLRDSNAVDLVVVDVGELNKISAQFDWLGLVLEFLRENSLIVMRGYVSGENELTDRHFTFDSEAEYIIKAVGSSWCSTVVRWVKAPSHGPIYADDVVLKCSNEWSK